MVLPSPDNELVAVSYTKDVFVHLLNSTTKKVVACLESPRSDSLIHTGTWHVDASNRLYFMMVDMTGSHGNQTGGGGLLLWSVDATPEGVEAQLLDTLSVRMHSGGTTKPIAAYSNPYGDHASVFAVTDAFGGLHFANVSDGEVVYLDTISQSVLGDSGGGLWIKPHPTDGDIVVAQYGKQEVDKSFLFAVNMRTLSLDRTFNLPSTAIDAHGIEFCRSETSGALYMINTNRVSATLDILRYDTGAVVRTYDLDSLVSDSYAPRTTECVGSSEDDSVDSDVPRSPPAPSPPPYEFTMGRRRIDDDNDTPAVSKRMMPDIAVMWGRVLYIVTRGRFPLSAVSPANWFADAQAAVYSFDVAPDCESISRDPVSSINLSMLDARTTIEAADGHGMDLVNGTLWVIDQSPTGKLVQTSSAGSLRVFEGVNLDLRSGTVHVPKPFIGFMETAFNSTLMPNVVQPPTC